MAKAFYYLRHSASNGNLSSICVGLRHKDGQFLISTGIRINPKHWNSKKGEVKVVSLPELDIKPEILKRKDKNEDIISFTNNTLNDISNFINRNSHLSREVIKSEFANYLFGRDEAEELVFRLNSYLLESLSKAKSKNRAMSKEMVFGLINGFIGSSENQIGFFQYASDFIDQSEKGQRLNSGKKINYLTVKKYRSTLSLLKDFESEYVREVNFSTIDKEFIDSFNSYMAEVKKYAPATMGKHVSILKTFLKEATEDGVNQNMAFKTKAFNVVETVSDSIALSPEELEDIYNLDLSESERLDRVRDLFIVAANTGLRFSDFTEIKSENIKKNIEGYTIEKIQYKTKGKVLIPLNETVLEIVKKYDFKLPEAISNQKFNKYLKEVVVKAKSLKAPYVRVETKGGIQEEVRYERWELVSSHTARRSFATNAYERGVPSLSIMAITGHKTEKAFLSYIKTSSKKHAEIFRKYDI